MDLTEYPSLLKDWHHELMMMMMTMNYMNFFKFSAGPYHHCCLEAILRKLVVILQNRRLSALIYFQSPSLPANQLRQLQVVFLVLQRRLH